MKIYYGRYVIAVSVLSFLIVGLLAAALLFATTPLSRRFPQPSDGQSAA